MAVATYVIVGCLVNAFARQKRGIEIIPNLEFWKDFPFLLKVSTDLFVFVYCFFSLFVPHACGFLYMCVLYLSACIYMYVYESTYACMPAYTHTYVYPQTCMISE